MKKFFILPILVVMVFLASAGGTERAKAIVGSNAPALEIKNDYVNTSLAQLHGKYVVLNFWTTSDPASRATCALLSHSAKRLQVSDIQVLSICMDSESTMHQINRLEGMDENQQFAISGLSSESMAQEYGVTAGEGKTFLISPDGTIIDILNIGTITTPQDILSKIA